MRKPIRFRAATGPVAAAPDEAAAPHAAAREAVALEAAALPAAAAKKAAPPRTVSFERDIRPMFEPFASAMMWRFDLTDYVAVMANAQTIYGRLSDPGNAMPPPPFPMFTEAQLDLFQTWMNQGCKP